MRFSIVDIEKKLEVFFETKLQSLFHKNPLISLTENLVEVFENGIRDVKGSMIAPNIFKINIREKALFNNHELEEWREFAQQLISELSEKNSYLFNGPIHVETFCDKTINKEFDIFAAFSVHATGKTINITAEPTQISDEWKHHSAFIILWNEETYRLSKKVTNIGRSVENDLIVDNLKVSRVHAQIRKMKNSFLLIDNNSVGGTKVNGNVIKQHRLSNGDVVEIADIPLIFSYEDNFTGNYTQSVKTKPLRIKNTGKNL